MLISNVNYFMEFLMLMLITNVNVNYFMEFLFPLMVIYSNANKVLRNFLYNANVNCFMEVPLANTNLVLDQWGSSTRITIIYNSVALLICY